MNVICISFTMSILPKRVVIYVLCCKLVSGGILFPNGLHFNLSQAFKRPSLDGRIVGGRDSDIKNFPYQLSLQYSGQHICGASIISAKYAVTAGHCTNGASADVLTIRSGTSLRENGGTVTKVKSINQHPKFDMNTVDYDISILELSNDLTFGDSTKPIAVANQDATEGSMAVVSGWGSTKENGRLPDQLQSLEVPIANRLKCQIVYALFNSITERMLCAGNAEGGQDTCQGDSGGPLVVNGQLTGIVSWGFGCARRYFPGVYSRVANADIRKYIKDVAGL